MNLTYSSLISEERIACGDLAKYIHDQQIGDGITTILITSEQPVGTATLLIKKDGTAQIEGTATDGYIVDYQRGVITFATAAAADATLTADYQRERLTDETWVNIVNDTIRDMTPDFWKEVIDTTTSTTVANQKTYDLPSGCLMLVNAYFKTSSAATENYQTLKSGGYNWRYSRDLNQLILGDTMETGGYPLRWHYLSSYTLSTLTTATVDVQDAFKTVLQCGVRQRYWEYRQQDKVNLTSMVATEKTMTPLQNILALAQYWGGKYQLVKRSLKPTKPSRPLSSYVEGAGIP